jgi:hypothetical protein
MYDNWWTCLFDYLQVHDRSANMFEQQPGRQFSVCMVVGQSGIELNRFTHDSQQMKRSGIQPFEWCSTSVGFQASTICTVCVRAHLQFCFIISHGVSVIVTVSVSTRMSLSCYWCELSC